MKIRDNGTSFTIEERIKLSGSGEPVSWIDHRVDVYKKTRRISACATGEMSVRSIDQVIACLQLAKQIADREIELEGDRD